MFTRTSHVVAFYEIDRAYGGPEEGGWWYDTGELQRTIAEHRDAERAYAYALRANRLLDRLQRHSRSPSSMAYSGGRHAAWVFEDTAPTHYPLTRPRYE